MSQAKANQAVFDAALTHIRQQGRRSMRGTGKGCAYRAPNGDMCAFGPSIKDYKPEMETKSAHHIINEYHECLHTWAQDVNPNLADAVQRCHDRVRDGGLFLMQFNTGMLDVAERYGLTYSE